MDSLPPLQPRNVNAVAGSLVSRKKKKDVKGSFDKVKNNKSWSTLKKSSEQSTEIGKDEFELLDQKSNLSDEEISKFMSDLSHYGDELKRQPSLKVFYAYRSLIETIFRRIMNQTITLDKVETSSGKEFHFLTIVNSELSSLLKMIQTEQQENIALIKQVIKVNGLIVDYLA